MIVELCQRNKAAGNERFCEIGGWSDNLNCGGSENRRW